MKKKKHTKYIYKKAAIFCLFTKPNSFSAYTKHVGRPNHNSVVRSHMQIMLLMKMNQPYRLCLQIFAASIYTSLVTHTDQHLSDFFFFLAGFFWYYFCVARNAINNISIPTDKGIDFDCDLLAFRCLWSPGRWMENMQRPPISDQQQSKIEAKIQSNSKNRFLSYRDLKWPEKLVKI